MTEVDRPPIRCKLCGEHVPADDSEPADHLRRAHPEFPTTNAHAYFEKRTSKADDARARSLAGTEGEQTEPVTARARKVATTGAVRAATGIVRAVKWWLKDSVSIGPKEPSRKPSDEPTTDFLRKKRYDENGVNYGPHDDAGEQLYVRDRHGNLRPYDS